jgi:hypothetical protein
VSVGDVYDTDVNQWLMEGPKIDKKRQYLINTTGGRARAFGAACYWPPTNQIFITVIIYTCCADVISQCL